MSWFDDEYGEGALEKFRAAAEVKPFDQVKLTEPHSNDLRFEMSGPDGAWGLVRLSWSRDQINWYSMEVQPPGMGIMGRLAEAWGPVLKEIGINEMRISGSHLSFERIGFADEGTGQLKCPVERLVEYGEYRRGEIEEPEWR